LRNNYKVIVQFDGTDYFGWQSQGEKFITVQGEMIKILSIIAKKRVIVTGSSRTDAGVHSEGLTANFFLKMNIEEKSLQRAMNSLLPESIRITSCEIVDPSFNARFNAKMKTYTYRIYTGQVLSPFMYRFYTHLPYPLDKRSMKKSIKYFKGEKNFSSFTSDEPKKKRIREIKKAVLKIRGDEIIIIIEGKSFLRYMVRNIVGTIIDIGRGKLEVSDIDTIFQAKDRRAAGQTAPAKGLTLTKVQY